MLSQTEKIFLFGSYILGFIASIYIGMQIQKWKMREYIQRKVDFAYDRGWDAGYAFVDKINEERVEMESAVRILQGQEIEGDRPFPRVKS